MEGRGPHEAVDKKNNHLRVWMRNHHSRQGRTGCNNPGDRAADNGRSVREFALLWRLLVYSGLRPFHFQWSRLLLQVS